MRPDSDFYNITGDAVLGEPRFNPDGTLDMLKWSRPQHDGPASRALTLLRFWSSDAAHDGETRTLARALIAQDLEFTFRHWREPSFDIWEEELGRHYYTRLAQHAALADGALWFEEIGEPERAHSYRAAAQEIGQSLDEHWSAEKGFYLSRLGAATSPEKDLDIATILAAIHAGRKEGAHSILDPKAMATLSRLEGLFASTYPINRICGVDRAPRHGPLCGRPLLQRRRLLFFDARRGQFYFRFAGAVADGATIPVTAENEPILLDLLNQVEPDGADRRTPLEAFCATSRGRARNSVKQLLRRGDAFMATVKAYTPPSGELSEQFDQATGAQTSAKSLAWSHAAFITAFASREAALSRRRPPGAST